MSTKLDVGINAARAREMWKDHMGEEHEKEEDRFNARKHRLVALFGSKDCYSANVHTDTNDLRELVDSLVRLDRLPNETPPEGLKLLAQAWDENRGKYEEWSPRQRPNRPQRPPLVLFSCPHKHAAVLETATSCGGACPMVIRCFSLYCCQTYLAIYLK